ncbi:MAG: YafY family protein [candidate division Zixibacteria bacterium]
MRKTERLLYILSLLRTHRRMRAIDLARKCEVTERTIYRDIISISAANIPIYFDGGYKLLHNEFLPPSNLSSVETGFLLSLLSSPMFDKGKPFRDTARRIAEKLEVAGSEKADISSIDIGVVSTERVDNHKHTSSIEKAVRNKINIVIGYESLKGEKTERKISPYAMAFRKHAWYLVGYCHLRDDIRTFRLGRVHDVRLSREKFEIPGDFSIEKYFSASWGVYRGKLIKFKVKFRGEAAIIVKTSRHQQYEEIEEFDDGTVIYKAVVAGRVEFIRWVLGFGAQAEIIEPVSARREILKILGTTIAKYDL